MKNFEKYKTSKERVGAFRKFCNPVVWNCTKVCKVGNANELGGVDPMECFSNWLDLEADEAKPLPCPVCGSDMSVSRTFMHCTRTNAEWCGYSITWGGEHGDKDKAIAAHNRVCKAVAAYKESEVK